MKEYDIKITETLERTVTVKAESVDDAKAQVEEEWGKSMHVLDSEDFTGVEFTMQEERSLNLEKMDVLLIEPGQFPKRVQIGNELEDLQVAVGGYIEATYPFEDEVAIILNEEGKINGMPLNRAVFTEDQVYHYDVTDKVFEKASRYEDRKQEKDKFHEKKSVLEKLEERKDEAKATIGAKKTSYREVVSL